MMLHTLHELERTEHRVLGGIAPVDGTTGGRIVDPLQVSAPGTRIVRNHSGLYVIWAWDALPGHATSFAAPPPTPGVGTQDLVLTLRDPAGVYLPRTVRVALPRNPASDPVSRASATSLFQPVVVPMLRAPRAPVVGNWARLDIRVVAAMAVGDEPGDALGGALIIVRDAGNAVLARGLTDWRGEAVVPVAGVPITTFSSDPDAVVVSEIAATVQAVFVPAWGSRVPQAQVAAGLAPAGLPGPVDPDRVATHPDALAAAPVAIQLAARGVRSVSLEVTLP